MYKSFVKNNRLVFAPFFIEPVALDPELMQWDSLHPNAAAQPIILQRVECLLNSVLNNRH